jgi:serine/threonine-protein kinase RsbW
VTFGGGGGVERPWSVRSDPVHPQAMSVDSSKPPNSANAPYRRPGSRRCHCSRSNPGEGVSYVAQVLRGNCDGALLDRAVVLTEELVQNAVWYTRGDFAVTVTVGDDHIRIGVSDQCADRPVFRRPDWEMGRGRGLAMLNKMTSRWGVRSASSGKTVWFERPRAWPTVGIVRKPSTHGVSVTGVRHATRTAGSTGAVR